MSAIGADKLQQVNMHTHQNTMKATPEIETVKDDIHDHQDPHSATLSSGGDGQDQDGQPLQHAQSTVGTSSSMIMTDAGGGRWTCTIPKAVVHHDEPEPEKTPQEIEEEKQRSIKRGLELLEHLTKRCLRSNYGYWTYEYCHKKWIRQYHALDNGKWEPASEDSTHVLGVYQHPSEKIQGQQNLDGSVQQQKLSNPRRPTTTTELGVSNERRYLVQRWSHGAKCDLTGAPRTVEVQFQCANVDDRIQLVTEPSTCNYIMVIYSSSLCKDVAFELIPAPEANKIDCRRIVTDEVYERSKAPRPEAIEGEPGSVTFQDSTGQIKLKQNEEKSESPLDGAPQEGLQLPLVFKEMAALMEEVEAAKNKQLDDLLAEIDVYLQVLKPYMTEAQQEMFQKMKDFAAGKTDRLNIVDYDQNAQQLDMDALVEALLGKVKDKETKPQDGESHSHQKEIKHDTPEIILDTPAETNDKTVKDSISDPSGDAGDQHVYEKDKDGHKAKKRNIVV
ncbi:Protein OS-9 [Mortierella sp. NVP85]|nr:Protein OS-9 [Mortierella sp. NVP85]